MCQENCNILAISEIYWDAAISFYKLFRRNRIGKRGSGMERQYIGECFDFSEVNDANDSVESLWAKIRRKSNKADILVGICYEETIKIFFMPSASLKSAKNITQQRESSPRAS